MTSEADERGRPAANSHARTRSSGPFTVVEVSGEIDMATAGFVVEHLDTATAVPEPDVLVDLRPVDFFDCSGLRVLCRAETRARERGGRLRIVSDGPRIDRLLRASGLLGRFPPLRTLPESPGLSEPPGPAGLPESPGLPELPKSPGLPGLPGERE